MILTLHFAHRPFPPQSARKKMPFSDKAYIRLRPAAMAIGIEHLAILFFKSIVPFLQSTFWIYLTPKSPFKKGGFRGIFKMLSVCFCLPVPFFKGESGYLSVFGTPVGRL
jgi:hypothetical protein